MGNAVHFSRTRRNLIVLKNPFQNNRNTLVTLVFSGISEVRCLPELGSMVEEAVKEPSFLKAAGMTGSLRSGSPKAVLNNEK